MNNNPIGILDSGLGGLTVWKEIVALLPHESIVYIGDSKNTPYGNKSPEEIFQLAKRSSDFLLTKNVKLVVTACNAITVSCVDQLRAAYPQIQIVGTVPAIKTAAMLTKKKRIGILATTRTTTSEYQENLIQQFASDCQIFKHGTDELVPLIEKAELQGDVMTETLKQILIPFQKEEVDCVVLGCTHFPFLRDQMQNILGSEVHIIDSGDAIARRVKWLLEEKQLQTTATEPAYEFFTTGDPAIANKLITSTIKVKTPEFQSVTL